MSDIHEKKLVLVRHSYALSTVEAGVPSDFERPLSAKGEEAAVRLARLLSENGIKKAALLASPLKRAAETAAIIAEYVEGEIKTDPRLSGDYSITEMWTAVFQALEKTDCLVVVSHQPLIGMLAGVLCGRQAFAYRPAGFTIVSFAGQPGRELFCAAASEVRSVLEP